MTLLWSCPAILTHAAEDEEEAVFELNPFVVESDEDEGYLATNVISGTRLNTSIQDLPMTVEVITSELIEDTGATDFNEAISYTAGVFFENPSSGINANVSDDGKSVGSAERSPSSAGNVGDYANNSITIRGFDVPFQMRDGFRIGTSISNLGIVLGGTIDPVNVDRMEVVRGPGALLYGLSVLSGIVNVIPKKPKNELEASVDLTVGNFDFFRFSADMTGPITDGESKLGELSYRFAYATEDRGDWTQFRETEKDVYIAQLQYRPLQRLTLFAEYFRADSIVKGIGQQFVSDNLGSANNPRFRNEFNELVNWAREYGDEGPGFRWSGPDSFFEREEDNFILDAQLRVSSNLFIKAGAYYSEQETRTFAPRMFGATNRVGELTLGPRFENQYPTYGLETSKVVVFENERPDWIRSPLFDTNDYKTIYYWWSDLGAKAESTQLRAEGNYRFELPFWKDFAGEQNLLVGWSSTDDTTKSMGEREHCASGDCPLVTGRLAYSPPGG